ncbi:hypothetical protein OROGR_027336 [Orobanche gracilis]
MPKYRIYRTEKYRNFRKFRYTEISVRFFDILVIRYFDTFGIYRNFGTDRYGPKAIPIFRYTDIFGTVSV